MSDPETLPWFPIPFWDADTIMSTTVFPRDNERMLVPAPRTLLERKLDAFTEAIRDKSEWWKKVDNPEVVERWRFEAAQQDVDDGIFNFAIQQLRHQAGQCDELGVRPSPVPGVFESEQLLDTDLQQELLAALKPLEGVPDEDKDWHPGSNKQVLDLVHPSLFPLVYGLSRTTTSARPPPPRNGQITASVSSPPHSAVYGMNVDDPDGDGAWDADGEEVWGEGVEPGFPDGPDGEDPNAEDFPFDGPEDQGELPDPGGDDLDDDMGEHDDEDNEDFPEQMQSEEEEDGYGNLLHDRMAVAAGQSKEERAGVAAAAAAALSWHTPAFNVWKTTMGAGTPITDPPSMSSFISEKFQWLPADVLVGTDGRVVFDSYVNNMHPERHAALYAATARLLGRMLPLLEHTLSLAAQRPERVVKEGDTEDKWDLQSQGDLVAALKASGEMLETGALAAAPDDVLDEDDLWELLRERRRWVGPELPAAYEPPEGPPAVNLKGRNLQVIVKYAEIVLTPERPEYGGGVWHVEGMENEAIAASCIAYLAADNISESRIHFRTMVENPEYNQNDWDGVENMYGMVDEEPVNEPLGSVLCAPGRMLCWPNVFQHRVAPFRLADASRPGRRTVAVAFLVDPTTRVLSTRDVPPQQMEWHDAESRLGSLVPEEVKERLDAVREFPVSLARAQELRLELMAERSAAVESANEEIYERVFSLCEH